MAFDAFDAGIEPGGLRSKSEIKLLICYLLNTISPLSKDNIYEIMQGYGLANYFEVGESITELMQTKAIEEICNETTQMYSITSVGTRSAQMLEASLPLSIREKSVNIAMELMARVKRERENDVTIEKINNKFYATCKIMDNGVELMNLSLCVADELQAQTIKRNFLLDPTEFYMKIISNLSKEN